MANPQHVIIIAFENRSFDHMLGFAPPGGALTGQESNPVDPAHPDGERVLVNKLAGPITTADPSHSFEGVREQLFGTSLVPLDPAPMNGFVSNYIKDVGDITRGKAIMECFAPESLPILSGLAQNFCVCTRWFASVPGPTWPNRFYMHAATSRGLVTNDPLDFGAPTIFDKLDGAKHAWRIYAGDIPVILSIERLAKRFVLDQLTLPKDHHFQPLAQFFNDLTAGTLPAYSFIEPQYFDTPFGQASDQHPPHSVAIGEALLGHIYNALRQSTYWQSSVLLVLFDEHGGFFDSISPPTGLPAPDDFRSTQPAFDFTRLGVRVPAVIVSPFVEPGSVDATVYDHASIPATLNAVFGLGPTNFLTRRDAAANTFDKNLSRSTARLPTDVFQADTSRLPPLAEVAPPQATVSGLSQALEIVRNQTTQSTLASLSSHQRRLAQLADSLLKSL